MNNGTFEGILNQQDAQEHFGDDARPFYPERAEVTVFRARTHFDGCHRVHPECALLKIPTLEAELEAAQARSGAKSFALEELRAQLDAGLTEANESDDLITRLRTLLENTANALHGGTLGNGLWGWNDLPQLAAKLNRELDAALTEANELRERLERAVEGATEWRKRAEKAESDATKFARRVQAIAPFWDWDERAAELKDAAKYLEAK